MPFLRALRPHQWTKNLLVFVPLVGAHRWNDPQALADTALAFVAWCIAASAMYVVNDLLDVEADRAHPYKRSRPFASGALSRNAGWTMAVGLAAIGAVIALQLPASFRAWLAAYVVLALAYSLHLKRVVLVDVLLLALLYNLRIFGGGAAAGIFVSEWLIGFATFFFLSLALMKRYAELGLDGTLSDAPNARGYHGRDRLAIGIFGASSAFAAVLVMALYITGRDVEKLYRHPAWLWAVCPILLYWLARAWLLAFRDAMRDDPVLFAQTDALTYAVLLALAAAVLLAL
jgi:4-hydroxybenzoate polyprenyltransferase